jgi:hypothetical protein
MTTFAEPGTRRCLTAAFLVLALLAGGVGGFLHVVQSSPSPAAEFAWLSDGSTHQAHSPHSCTFCFAGTVLDLSLVAGHPVPRSPSPALMTSAPLVHRSTSPPCSLNARAPPPLPRG